ncbi:PaaI family thioesterase [Microvirga zambiensis]|uniref:PaaI family thioesterase n=1 Tax=Microvirga zambiensis TaxID=1402137 RepID=UPI00191FC4FB|nr:PaaI family thioesterase [Microvirga zambiensis]
MTCAASPPPYDPAADGWIRHVDDGFIEWVGPIWEKRDESGLRFGFLADARHRNRSGVVQGGMLATLADRAMGVTARGGEDHRQATIQLSLAYVASAAIGEFVEARCEIIRRTRSVIFMSATLASNGRIVATASGVWKIKGR